MCSIVPIKFLLHTEFRDKKLQRGSKEDGVMLRKGLANSAVEVVVIVYIRCSSLDHPPFASVFREEDPRPLYES